MLVRMAVFAGGIVAAAMVLPGLATSYLDRPQTDTAAKPAQASPAKYVGGKGVIMQPGPGGHFSGTFTINGRKADGLVDTGASYVALNETMARRLGYTANQLDFRYSVNTANGHRQGRCRDARSRRDRRIRVKDVEAIVLKDEALSATLVGMSFLQKLASYSVADGSLSLSPLIRLEITGRQAGASSPIGRFACSAGHAPSMPDLRPHARKRGLARWTFVPSGFRSLKPTVIDLRRSGCRRPPPRSITAMPTSRALQD
jgi:aspartyl protease family protein